MNYWNFVTCQRADGRVYGNGGNTCHLGREISPTELTKRRKEGMRRAKNERNGGSKTAKIRYRPDRLKRDLKGVKVARGVKVTRVTRGQTDPSTHTDKVLDTKTFKLRNKKVIS